MNDRSQFLKEVNAHSEIWETSESRKKFKEGSSSRYRNLSRIFDSNRLNNVSVVGRLVMMLKSLGNASQEEWESFYREECERVGRKGLLTELSWRLWNLGGWEYGKPATMLAYVVSRVIDETYEGVAYEWIALEMIREEWGGNYTVRDATDEEERDASIDIVVEKNGQIVQAYQVKPDSFFSPSITRERNAGLFKDRVKNCTQMHNLAVHLDDFESVAFLKKSDIINHTYNPLLISTFNTDGSLSNAL